jgi:hypothetical protein
MVYGLRLVVRSMYCLWVHVLLVNKDTNKNMTKNVTIYKNIPIVIQKLPKPPFFVPQL